MSQALVAALTRLLNGGGVVAASAFSKNQRNVLDDLARQTGAVRVASLGRGIVYEVIDNDLLVKHLQALRPKTIDEIDTKIPNRAVNIARSRNSKRGVHRHEAFYWVIKSISDDVYWECSSSTLNLSLATKTTGAGVIALTDSDDTWRSEQPLWLVENQALFDRLDWLPPNAVGTIAYYAGELPGRLLNWLASRQRVPQIILFADYDGVGLMNYARLCERNSSLSSFWLMPNWREKLQVYGNNQIWLNTQPDFLAAVSRLESLGKIEPIADLCKALSDMGFALEHEAIWL